MGYIYRTRFLLLIIEINKEGNVHICIDRAHAVYNDAKGHSGLYLTMGHGAMINISKKLGVVTTSSTETEVVSCGERFPNVHGFDTSG